ncbi:MAG: protein O-mannosyl-transferase family [Fidelibacterota bacterium]
MDFIKKRKLKLFLAATTFFLSLIVYIRTVAPTVSFWDCGEYIATSYILGIPHPPGNPLFILVGRLFTMLPIGSDIAYRANLVSPLVSALSVMFLFLIIAQLLKKWNTGDSKLNNLVVFGGAFIGAMTFAFTDSHWFNAVEFEVYAFSTFLTAIVVWLILKWEEQSDKIGHERYILIIAYIMGLAIGVHLLNLLTIFFIALIIYFKRKNISSIWWLVLDLIIGVAIVSVLFLVFNSSFSDPDEAFNTIAFLTLASFGGIYFGIWKLSSSPRLLEHVQNVMMSVIASIVFLIVNNVIIHGIPKKVLNFGTLSIPLFFAVVFGIIIWSIKNKRNIIAIISVSFLLIIIGYSTYLTLFIRSNQNPRIDENDPETLESFISYLGREQYGTRSFSDILDRKVWKPEAAHKYEGKGGLYYFWNYQVKKMYIRYFNWQFIGRDEASVDPFQFIIPLPFLIGIFGMLTHFQRDNKKALSVLALFLFTGFMILLYLNQPDPQPRERDYSYVGSFFAFSIWIGIGAAAILETMAKLKKKDLRKGLTWAMTILLIIALPLNVLRANYHEHSRWGNYVASDYSYNILNTCEEDAIIFTNGDNDTFPLWYLQEVEGVRRDVRVVNLSLLNTHWYIKQLQTHEPQVDIGNMSEEAIERLTVIPWKAQTIEIDPPKNSDIDPLRWKLEPTIMERGLRVQDLMILQIMQNNNWKRPVYFAVTVSTDNMLGLRPYLQMEGLGWRLHPEKVKSQIDADRMKQNIMEVYRYRNLDNPDVYFNPNIQKLVGNYRSGFFQLAIHQLRSKKYKETMETLEAMEKFMPEEVLPIDNDQVYLQLGMLYHEAKRKAGLIGESDGEEVGTDKDHKPLSLEKRLENLIAEAQEQKDINSLVEYTGIYISQLNKPEKAVDILENLRLEYPNQPRVLVYLVQAYEQLEDYENAVELLNSWLEDNPEDNQARQMRENYKRMIKDAVVDTVEN